MNVVMNVVLIIEQNFIMRYCIIHNIVKYIDRLSNNLWWRIVEVCDEVVKVCGEDMMNNLSLNCCDKGCDKGCDKELFNGLLKCFEIIYHTFVVKYFVIRCVECLCEDVLKRWWWNYFVELLLWLNTISIMLLIYHFITNAFNFEMML